MALIIKANYNLLGLNQISKFKEQQDSKLT